MEICEITIFKNAIGEVILTPKHGMGIGVHFDGINTAIEAMTYIKKRISEGNFREVTVA